MRNFKLNILALTGVCFFFCGLFAMAAPTDDTMLLIDEIETPEDTTKEKDKKNSKPSDYKEKDRQGDEFSNRTSESPLLLDKPSNINTDVTLDTSGRFFTIEEKVGEEEYRPPSVMSYDEYMRYQHRQMLQNYWQNKSGDSSGLRARKDPKAGPLSLKIPVKGLEGPFGSDYVDIKPNGLVTLDFGYKHQHTYNPQVPKRQQKQGSFDFDNQIQMNIVGKIGEKLKLTVNWDTKATFEFQNNFKIEYTGYEHDILQKVEVGQVAMPINSSLIQGAQNLFGVKTKMQFGRLTMTSVVATQRGKSESVSAQGGSTTRPIDIKGDNYEDYRHFFLGHFFRDNYEKSVKNLPIVTSGAKVTQIDVYITNSNNTTVNTRDVVGFMDLGEPQAKAYNQTFFSFNSTIAVNDNKANSIFDTYETIVKNPLAMSDVISQDIQKGTEFEVLSNARKLKPEEFTYNADLGYITLLTPLRSYEVLAVAYEYSYKGVSYSVGDVSTKTQNSANDTSAALRLKLLKPSSIKTRIPTWDLMMKNIYSLGASQISRENFQLRVIYKDDISGADIPNLQEGALTKDQPLVKLLGGDQLNMNGDPYPDGNMDFVEGVTIDSRYGRVIFPVLEPFGNDLQQYFIPTTEAGLINKYVFFELYDSTKSDASQIASKNKFYIKGRFQSSSSSEIPLQGAINLAPGSVKVTAGSRTLQEGIDYTVDYNQGKVKILNEGILASNQEIKISYEKQDLFNVRQKSFYGTRLDYRVNKDVNIGGTLLHQNERPTLTRVNIGDEPSSNTIWGLDANIKRESRFLTKAIDFLPLIQTKVPSSITAQAEVAQLVPGHNKALDKNGSNGAAYIDDFEASETPYDFVRSPTKWKLASVPVGKPGYSSTTLSHGYNRAKLSWYNVDPVFYQNGGSKPSNIPPTISNHFERIVSPQEIFPNLNRSQINTNQPILDVVYYPNERGPYNYDPATTFFGDKEIIPNPAQNWAGIMREIRNDVDFDNANIQYIEFWMLNPYNIKGNDAAKRTEINGVPFNTSNSGKLIFNLGSITEDVLKDDRLEFENGLPVANETTVTPTSWGRVSNQQPLTNAFSSQADARNKQDVGLDGLDNAAEATWPGVPSKFKNALDPAGDDFKYYLDAGSTNSVIDQYKNFNGIDKNSPVNSSSSNYTTPDNEDLNSDNTLNSLDEYYEYEVDINNLMDVGQKYIVGSQISKPDSSSEVEWLQFRIPIRTPDKTIGNISGFKTIRFMRMYVQGFTSPVVLRFGQLQLVANQWRIYQPDDINQKGFGSVTEPDDAQIIVSTVNIEENGLGSKETSGYILPPGMQRDQDPVSATVRNVNEQSLRLTVFDLDNLNARAAYKNVSIDMLNYKRLNMFVHAETPPSKGTKDGDMNAFIRLGTDVTENYYEIEVPLYFSAPGALPDANEVWKKENEIDLAIQDIIDVKLERNRLTSDKKTTYSKTIGNKIVNVVGNPDLSTVVSVMIGMRNPAKNSITNSSADVSPKTATIWVNELRVTDFENKSAWAATARVNAKLADLGSVTGSFKYTTVGFGGIDQRISQRQRANTLDYGASGSFALQKFIPEKVGIVLPLYLSYDRTTISPQYNPLDPDVKMSKYSAKERDTLRKSVADITTRRAINLTNFKKIKTKKDAKSHFYDLSNLTFTLGYNEVKRTSFEIKEYHARFYKAGIEYTHPFKPLNIEPFKKSKFVKSKYLRLVKDINVNPIPTSFTFRNDLNRTIIKTQYYEAGPFSPAQKALYEKSFLLTRTYALPWNITKSINLTYAATANAIVDEPFRDPGGKAYSDSLMSNFSRFGRLKMFDQSLNATYKVPLDKFPVTNWLNSDVNYSSGFHWDAGPVNLRDTLGNPINLGNMANNKGDVNFTGKINLETLYNKVKFLKEINTPKADVKGPKTPVNPNAKVPPGQADTTNAKKKPELKALKGALRAVMLVRNIMPTYSITRTTKLPGYMPTPTYLGVDARGDFDQTQHVGDALPFIFGSQDPNFRKVAANRGWLSRESELNAPYVQMRTHTFTAKTAIEPFRDFKVQLDIKKSKGSTYQEIYRVATDGGDDYQSFSPSRTGNYSISYISILTAFIKTTGADNFNKTFKQFSDNRDIILSRINKTGYIKNSQDVLVPAFLAAYSGRDARKQKLTSFPKIPLPNWNVTYSGLTRMKFFSGKFSSVTLNHGYTSTYAVGAYQSSLIYGDGFIVPEFGIEKGIGGDSVNKDGVIIPIYTFADVSIREQFGPLIGINLKSKGKVTYKIEYKRGRNLALSLSNAQLREDVNQDIVFGISYIKSGVKLPKFQGRSTVLKNELNMRLDMTIRDTKSYQRKIDQGSTITAGNLNFQIKPTISYMVSQRVTMLFYFEHTRAVPRLSSSFKRNTTSFGLQIRFTLS